MDPKDREAQRAAFREKNERRRQASSKTTYAQHGRELRQKFGGAFGRAPATTFNTCAEGLGIPKRAEHDLEEEPS